MERPQSLTRDDNLLSLLKLNREYKYQRETVQVVLHRFQNGSKGIILGDEVGLGKTYEALFIAFLHLLYSRKTRSPKILIIVPPNLRTEKWEKELIGTGFARCIKKTNDKEIIKLSKRFRDSVFVLKNKYELYDDGFSEALDSGIMILSPSLFSPRDDWTNEDKRLYNRRLNRIKQNEWDIIIVDEAHRYCRGGVHSDYVLDVLDRRSSKCKTILCTATPFQLETKELLELLRFIEYDEEKIEQIGNYIEKYNERFEDLRKNGFNEKEFLQMLKTKQVLEKILRSYILRNVKDKRFRISRVDNISDHSSQFDIFYLQFRNLIADYMRKGGRTFIPTMLQLATSSYDALKNSDNFHTMKDSVQEALSLGYVEQTLETHSSHPKEKRLFEIIENEFKSGDPLQKWVIFVNHLDSVTEILRKLGEGSEDENLNAILKLKLEERINGMLAKYGISLTTYLREYYYKVFGENNEFIYERLRRICSDDDIWKVEFHRYYESAEEKKALPKKRKLIDAFVDAARMKFEESTLKFDIIDQVTKQCGTRDQLQEISSRIVQKMLESIVLSKVQETLSTVEEADGYTKRRMRRNLEIMISALYRKNIVAKLTGETSNKGGIKDSFNEPYNPIILLVSRVGEEGIDLQRYCNNVIHYDLEWNPARIEQREGRVDRKGRIDPNHKIDIHTLVLSGTYDERIYRKFLERREIFELYLCSEFTSAFGLLDSTVPEIDADDKRVIDPIPVIPIHKANMLHLNLRPQN